MQSVTRQSYVYCGSLLSRTGTPKTVQRALTPLQCARLPPLEAKSAAQTDHRDNPAAQIQIFSPD